MIKFFKGLIRSRTVWFGAILTVLSSAASVIPMIYVQLDPIQLKVFRDMFGPEAMALVGLLVIVLRVITTKPLAER